MIPASQGMTLHACGEFCVESPICCLLLLFRKGNHSYRSQVSLQGSLLPEEGYLILVQVHKGLPSCIQIMTTLKGIRIS